MAVNLNILSAVYRHTNNHPDILPGSNCYLCQSVIVNEGRLLCADCEKDLPENGDACPVCAIPAPGGFMCSYCLRPQKQMPVRTFCIYRYVYPVSRLIQDMKFHSRLDIADFLGRKLAHFAISRSAEIPQCLIPVPLHSSRLRERGFNQAQELARVISDVSGIPVDNNMVERAYKTAAQSGLSALQRGRNIRGAFKSSHNMQSRYSHVAIIDDVVTTGSTAQELVRVLSKAGVSEIDVWACARAVIP